MDQTNERELLRLLTRESGAAEAARLRARIESDPKLRAKYSRLESSWSELESPPPPLVPQGFSARVLARARAERPRSVWEWAAAPRWARLAAMAAIVAGAALGSGLAAGLAPPTAREPEETVDFVGDLSLGSVEPGLAEWYVGTFETGAVESGEVTP
jgi:anti-sigma factor RsiW